MFSTLNRIIAPRHAEAADTRQEIKRHDPDTHRHKDSDENSRENPFEIDDNATLTISALRVFLENFLKSMQSTSEPQSRPPTPDNRQPTTGLAARAAGAYESIQQTTQAPPAPIPETPHNTTPELASEEIRAIYKLLEDLKTLESQNVEVLTLEKSATFLGSLAAAVEKLKQG